jgi:hypothetical protein
MAPLAPCGIKEVFTVPLCSTKSGRLLEVSQISKQNVLYQARGGTCYPRGSTPKNRFLANLSKTNHEPWRSQPSTPYHTLLKPRHLIMTKSTTIPQDERLRVKSHLVGWKTTNQHNSLSRKITDHELVQHLTRWKTGTWNHDSRAKRCYLDTNPQPKGYKWIIRKDKHSTICGLTIGEGK